MSTNTPRGFLLIYFTIRKTALDLETTITYGLGGRTRQQRSMWMWSISLSIDTSEIHFQMQKCMQNTTWERTGVPNHWKTIYRTMQKLEIKSWACSGSTDSKTLDYQRTNPKAKAKWSCSVVSDSLRPHGL